MSVPILPAATVVLLREGAAGPEVLLVQRHRRSGFMPGVWVFPGGRVERSDAIASPRIRGGEGIVEAFGLGEDGRGWLVGAVRETFEEAGVWLGAGRVPVSAREALRASAEAFGALLEEHDATLDLDVLWPWSRWVTPVGPPRRFDTLFLLAALPPGAEVVLDEHEAVDRLWARPADVLARGPSSIPLSPPTWWTLKELADVPSLDAARVLSRALDPAMPDRDDVDPEQGMAVRGPHPQVPVRIRITDDGWRCTRAG